MKQTKRNLKNYIIPILIVLVLSVFTVYAGVTLSNNPNAYLNSDNITVNNSGVYYKTSADIQKLTKTADVVVCRGTSVLDDLIKSFTCDVVCKSTDNDCSSELEQIRLKIGTTGGNAFINCGVYNVTRGNAGLNALNWTFLKNVNIIGANRECVKIIQTNGAYDVVSITNSSNLYISDLTFDGSSYDAESGIAGANLNNVHLDRLNISCSNDIYCVYFSGPTGGSSSTPFSQYDNNNKITNSIIKGNYTGDVLSWSLQRNSILRDNFIENGRVALYFGYNINFVGNTVFNSTSEGVYITGPYDIGRISGNSFINNTLNAIRGDYILDGQQLITIENNYITTSNLTGGGIQINLNGTWIIKNNIFNQIAGRAIYGTYHNGGNIEISGNSFINIDTNMGNINHGIYFEANTLPYLLNIQNNNFYKNYYADCIHLDDVVNATISNNNYNSCGSDFLETSNANSYISYSNNENIGGTINSIITFGAGTMNKTYADYLSYTVIPTFSTCTSNFPFNGKTVHNSSTSCTCIGGAWKCWVMT